MKLDKTTIRKIAIVAHEQGKLDFLRRKNALISEVLRVHQAGGDIEQFLMAAYTDATKEMVQESFRAIRANGPNMRAAARRASSGRVSA